MTLDKAILATLAYHDIFNYPLSAKEIHRYLINKPVVATSIKKTVQMLITLKKVAENQGYYSLAGRTKIANLRTRRARYSRRKQKKADFFGQILRVVPSVKMVAISGALAMANSHQDDDIDLVIICAKSALWTTRFLANLALLPFKRDPQASNVADRACLNLFLDEGSLKIRDQNLYIAHEICQMKPIWDRDNTYQKFIKANRWVKKYLPNWQPDRITSAKSQVPSHKSNKFLTYHLSLITERILRSFQLWYMRQKITTEKIGKGQLFFHPSNTQELVLKKYQKRLKSLKLAKVENSYY